ncbi:hypothetical protein NQ176_g3812 [Zarea fungicola]|uniref:Uncharacterized protein n=1 Tax=Zarea fungicola TaxID=93591 RepID=A0ACC1NGH6_9HYPO|nr:hypothetical protein NQ176_g3812 [Lecanicillium fungicola]
MAESGTGPTGPGPSIDPRLDTPLSIDEKQRREQEQQRALFLSRLSALMQQWERERNLPSTVNPQQDPASAGIASYDEERRKWERELDVIMQQWERSWNMPWTVKPKYGPAVAGLYWTKINAERFPAGQILSVVNLTFLSGVDVSDTSSAPGQLWEASLQYIASIPGCTYLKSASQEQEAVAVILWENCLSWKSFQQSTGFVRMAPILTQKMMNRSLRLPATVILGTKKYLQCIETTFEADLDSNARSRFEHQFLSIIEPYVTKHSLLASGWFENNASMSDNSLATWVDSGCAYLTLYMALVSLRFGITKVHERRVYANIEKYWIDLSMLLPTWTYHRLTNLFLGHELMSMGSRIAYIGMPLSLK